MSTPDQMAAEYNPAAIPPPPVEKVGDLANAHIGLTVDVAGVIGELMRVHNHEMSPHTKVVIQEPDRPFDTTFDIPSDTACEIVNGDLVQLTDVVSMEDFYELARELDRVSKEIRKNDESTKALKERKRHLSEKMLGTFAQVGQSALAVDDRRAYIHHELYPEFEEKDDGEKYTYRDLVPVLKAMGREEQVTAETVNYRTMQGILREIRDGVIPMPPEMAKMVKIGEKAEVRIGVGRKSTR